jgi:4-aminobutyrate aminotransferase/(S)-3-amino-2-methylpropionate transaminase
MGMTAKKSATIEAFGPFAGEVYQAPMAYPYRWPTGSARCAEEAADVSLAAITEQLPPDTIAALVIEPIQGEGGCIEPPPEFLPRLREFCSDNGIVFVADEVQTGMCRTGDWFACEHAGVVPDLIVTGKGLAGGLPLAAVTGRAELMNAVRTGIGGTFNGNPVACEAALGAIETMRSLDLASAARRIGEHALPRLWSLADRFAVLGDVRGRGALLGLEVVDPATRRPARKVAAAIARACHAEGLALVVAGKHGNVLRLTPPLVISMKLLTEGLDIIEKVMAGLEAEF